MDKTGRVQSVHRAILILECFSETRPEWKLSEIAEQLKLNKSTVHGLINTLKDHGIIDQDDETQKYRLGIYLMTLGDLVHSSMDIITLAKPYLQNISNQVQETIHLATLDHQEVVYLDKVESAQSMRIYTTRGSRNPAYCTGVGKVMLAFLEEGKLDEHLPNQMESYTPNTITDISLLRKELKVIRENGYAFDNEERDMGLYCVAIPIFNHLGRVEYSISVSGPSVRMTDEKIQMALNLLLKAGREISQKIGFGGSGPK